MKDCQADKVIASANEYLKQRNFCQEDNYSVKSEFSDISNSQISHEEQAGLKILIAPSSPNSFTFSTTSAQYVFIEQQYIRLKSWMTEASEPCRSELSQVLFPLFVHLFLELLSGAGKQPAKVFFNRHHQVFRVNRDYEQTLRQVWTAANETTLSPIIQCLKTGKYLVRLSELTFNYFLRYLQSSGNLTLLQIFNNYIEVELSEVSGNLSFALVKRSDQECNEDDFMESTQDVMDCSLDELRQIKDVISNVQTIKPLMPSLCVYSVINAFNGLSCAKVNNDSSILACGFEDSVIKLWRLTHPPHNISPKSSISDTKPVETVLYCGMSRVEEDFDPSSRFEKDDEEETKSLGGRHIRGGEFCTLRGHRGPVLDISFTHCSSYLFSVGDDAAMRLWDLSEQRAVALYQGHHYPIWCLDVSPQTLYIATGSYDQTVRLWTPEFTYPLRTLVGHSDSIDCVAFHPNCSYVASGSSDRSVRLWQVCDGSVVRILLHHSSPVKALSFSPNGKFLVSGSDNGEVVLWDLGEGKVLSQIGANVDGISSSLSSSPTTQHEPIVSLGWSKDSRFFFSATADGYVKGHNFDSNADGVDLNEIGNIYCGSSTTGVSLINTSLNSHNFLSSVVAVHGER